MLHKIDFHRARDFRVLYCARAVSNLYHQQTILRHVYFALLFALDIIAHNDVLPTLIMGDKKNIHCRKGQYSETDPRKAWALSMILKELRHGRRILKELDNFFKFVVRNLLHPQPSLFLFGLLSHLLCFSTLVNYYFEAFFNLKVILHFAKWLRISWHSSFKRCR